MIRNVVFDIGNVFVRWSPLEKLQACFPLCKPDEIWQKMRGDWLALNRGALTLDAALDRFQTITGLPREGFRRFCNHVMEDAVFLSDTEALQRRLKKAGVPLYYLSDNIHEVVAYYRAATTFMGRFDGGVISAEIGILKPDIEIYRHLCARYCLDPASCVFFDDVSENVEGARRAGMTAFVFLDAKTCARDLTQVGLCF